jgi:hypothetical protein
LQLYFNEDALAVALTTYNLDYTNYNILNMTWTASGELHADNRGQCDGNSGDMVNNKWRMAMKQADHIHIPRKRNKLNVKRNFTNANLKYLETWRRMSQDPFTFPIAVGLYPITIVTETTATIAKRIGRKGGKLL